MPGARRWPRCAGCWECSTAASDPRALAPQPGLADIEDLVSRTRTAGLETSLRVEGEPATVSPALDLCAYRIVQEALTNAIKHAGPARVTVCLRWTRDALELEVSDNGRGPIAVNGAAGGHGIAGMRERAALHGGDIQAGAGADGGFAVQARLPLAPERVAMSALRERIAALDRRRLDALARRDRSSSSSSSRRWLAGGISDSHRLVTVCRGRAVRRVDRGPAALAGRRAGLLLGGRH